MNSDDDFNNEEEDFEVDSTVDDSDREDIDEDQMELPEEVEDELEDVLNEPKDDINKIENSLQETLRQIQEESIKPRTRKQKKQTDTVYDYESDKEGEKEDEKEVPEEEDEIEKMFRIATQLGNKRRKKQPVAVTLQEEKIDITKLPTPKKKKYKSKVGIKPVAVVDEAKQVQVLKQKNKQVKITKIVNDLKSNTLKPVNPMLFPFGPLSNNYKHDLYIDNNRYKSVTNFVLASIIPQVKSVYVSTLENADPDNTIYDTFKWAIKELILSVMNDSLDDIIDTMDVSGYPLTMSYRYVNDDSDIIQYLGDKKGEFLGHLQNNIHVRIKKDASKQRKKMLEIQEERIYQVQKIIAFVKYNLLNSNDLIHIYNQLETEFKGKTLDEMFSGLDSFVKAEDLFSDNDEKKEKTVFAFTKKDAVVSDFYKLSQHDKKYILYLTHNPKYILPFTSREYCDSVKLQAYTEHLQRKGNTNVGEILLGLKKSGSLGRVVDKWFMENNKAYQSYTQLTARLTSDNEFQKAVYKVFETDDAQSKTTEVKSSKDNDTDYTFKIEDLLALREEEKQEIVEDKGQTPKEYVFDVQKFLISSIGKTSVYNHIVTYIYQKLFGNYKEEVTTFTELVKKYKNILSKLYVDKMTIALETKFIKNNDLLFQMSLVLSDGYNLQYDADKENLDFPIPKNFVGNKLQQIRGQLGHLRSVKTSTFIDFTNNPVVKQYIDHKLHTYTNVVDLVMECQKDEKDEKDEKEKDGDDNNENNKNNLYARVVRDTMTKIFGYPDDLPDVEPLSYLSAVVYPYWKYLYYLLSQFVYNKDLPIISSLQTKILLSIKTVESINEKVTPSLVKETLNRIAGRLDGIVEKECQEQVAIAILTRTRKLDTIKNQKLSFTEPPDSVDLYTLNSYYTTCVMSLEKLVPIELLVSLTKDEDFEGVFASKNKTEKPLDLKPLQPRTYKFQHTSPAKVDVGQTLTIKDIVEAGLAKKTELLEKLRRRKVDMLTIEKLEGAIKESQTTINEIAKSNVLTDVIEKYENELAVFRKVPKNAEMKMKIKELSNKLDELKKMTSSLTHMQDAEFIENLKSIYGGKISADFIKRKLNAYTKKKLVEKPVSKIVEEEPEKKKELVTEYKVFVKMIKPKFLNDRTFPKWGDFVKVEWEKVKNVPGELEKYRQIASRMNDGVALESTTKISPKKGSPLEKTVMFKDQNETIQENVYETFKVEDINFDNVYKYTTLLGANLARSTNKDKQTNAYFNKLIRLQEKFYDSIIKHKRIDYVIIARLARTHLELNRLFKTNDPQLYKFNVERYFKNADETRSKIVNKYIHDALTMKETDVFDGIDSSDIVVFDKQDDMKDFYMALRPKYVKNYVKLVTNNQVKNSKAYKLLIKTLTELFTKRVVDETASRYDELYKLYATHMYINNNSDSINKYDVYAYYMSVKPKDVNINDAIAYFKQIVDERFAKKPTSHKK
jgi:hypothetical protein